MGKDVPDENFSKGTVRLAILEFLGICQLTQGGQTACARIAERCTHLEVHVTIRAHEKALVLESPLEANIHRLARELLHKRLRVDRVDLEITSAPIRSDLRRCVLQT